MTTARLPGEPRPIEGKAMRGGRHPRRIWRVFPLLLALALLVPGGASASRWGRDYMPNVPVVSHEGKTYKFYDDLIKDKIVVVSFIYATCRDICPLVTARMAQLQDKLGDLVGSEIFLYSITVDPEFDTPEQLKKHAEAFNAGPGWLFLTGARPDIDQIRYKLGERSRSRNEHRNEILIGNGNTDTWGRDSVLGELDRLVLVIRGMDPSWTEKVRVPVLADADPKNYEVGGEPGQVLFRKMCSACHTVGGGDRVGPDLSGATERRDRAWLTSFITAPEKMLAKRDPITLSLVERYPGVRMPNLGLSENDAADVIAFLAEHDGKRKPSDFSLQPLLALTTQEGRRLSAGDIRGRPLGVVFGFTHCPDVCPTTLLELSNMLAELGKDADRLRVLFVSVDSERDTPAALKTYMASFDPRIIALTGNAAQIAASARAFDAHYEKVEGEGGEVTYDHSIKTYLVDAKGKLAGSIDLRATESDKRKALARLLARR